VPEYREPTPWNRCRFPISTDPVVQVFDVQDPNNFNLKKYGQPVSFSVNPAFRPVQNHRYGHTD
jgi:hypothetical protein